MSDSTLPEYNRYTDLVIEGVDGDRRFNAVFKGKIILVDDRGIHTGKYRDTELIYYGGRYYPTYNLTPSLGLRPDQILLPGEDHVTT